MIYVFKGKDVEKYSRWNDIRKPAKYSFAFEGDLWCQYSLQTRPWVDWAWEDREESQVPKFYINKLALYKALGL